MKLSNEEAYEIICSIRKHCAEVNHCCDCVFYNSDGDCAVSAGDISPMDWNPIPPSNYKVLF